MPRTGRLDALVLLALLAALGCRGSGLPPTVPVYEDLVLSGGLGPPHTAARPAETPCADETRFAIPLAPGAEVTLPLSPGEAPRLLVSACAPAAHGPDGLDAVLRIEVEGARGLATEARLDLRWNPSVDPTRNRSQESPGSGWAERTVDLSLHAGSRASLRLRVEGLAPDRGPVYVADLALRHRVEPPPPASRRDPPRSQVLFVSVDTLREDAIGALAGDADGVAPSSTPSLDALAREAEIWSPHHATASWTKPSHASMLTGLAPAVHGADSITGAIVPGVETLAERFAASGARTVGLVWKCEWLDPEYGFDRGFEGYRVVPWHAEQTTRVAANWLATHREESFFYFLHLFTPHSDGHLLPYEGEGASRASVEARFGVPDYGCRTGLCASRMLEALNGDLEPIPGETEILRHLYRRGVRDVDAALGALFNDLREAGLWDGLTVVFTSDHGEAFFEHGSVLHSTVHQEILRVPLLIKWPGGQYAGARRAVPTSAIDLAPTLLEAAGLPGEGLPGVALQSLRGQPASGRPRPIFAGTARRAVIDWPWKGIFGPPGSGRRPAELYRIDRDPRELENLAAEEPGETDRLGGLLGARMARDRALRERFAAGAGPDGAQARELTPEERRRLRALGYLD